MGFVVKRGDRYSARLVIPKALRPILGQNEFKTSLRSVNDSYNAITESLLVPLNGEHQRPPDGNDNNIIFIPLQYTIDNYSYLR